MIRLATSGDVASMVMLGRKFHARSGLARFAAWDDHSFTATLWGLLGPLDGVVMVVEEEDRLLGMMGCLLFPLYFNLSVRAAQEIFWYVDPSAESGAGTELRRTMEGVVRVMGGGLAILGALSDQRDAAVTRLLASDGYEPLERSHIKQLDEIVVGEEK